MVGTPNLEQGLKLVQGEKCAALAVRRKLSR